MNYKIVVLLLLLLSVVACKQVFNKFFPKTYNNHAVIEIKSGPENSERLKDLSDILKYRFDQYLIGDSFEINTTQNNFKVNVSNFENISILRSLLENSGEFRIVTLNEDGTNNESFTSGDEGIIVKKATVFNDKNQKNLNIEFNDEYKDKFAVFTEKNIGKKVALILDEKVLCSPVVMEKITGGKALLSMPSETIENLLLYKVLLLGGKLPFKLDENNMKITELRSNYAERK